MAVAVIPVIIFHRDNYPAAAVYITVKRSATAVRLIHYQAQAILHGAPQRTCCRHHHLSLGIHVPAAIICYYLRQSVLETADENRAAVLCIVAGYFLTSVKVIQVLPHAFTNDQQGV